MGVSYWENPIYGPLRFDKTKLEENTHYIYKILDKFNL